MVAFVTSRYTMDAKDSTVRRYLAQRAELLGAIRLPNDAFKKNAGAEVVSDIIFLQKRDRPLDIVPEWTQTGQTEDGFAINRYFIDHPEMVLGRQEPVSTAHGMDYTVNPIEGLKLSDQLHDAVKYIHGTYQEAELPELGEGEAIDTSIPADPNVKNYSYAIVDGQVYYRENSRMVRPDLNATAEARVKGLVGLRDCVQELIDLQMDAAVPDSTIREKQAELNSSMTAFLPNTVSSMTVQTVWPMQTILPITCSVRWKSSTRTESWNARQICSPSGPSSPIRRWLWWIRQVKHWRCPSRKKPAWIWTI